MVGQKQAVVSEVLKLLPSFKMYQDIALVQLSTEQLEQLKGSIQTGIASGTIEYSKDRSNSLEVRTYARSMVMNHLKKARELNGNANYASSTNATPSQKPHKFHALNKDIMTEELRAYVEKI